MATLRWYASMKKCRSNRQAVHGNVGMCNVYPHRIFPRGCLRSSSTDRQPNGDRSGPRSDGPRQPSLKRAEVINAAESCFFNA